MIAQCFTIGESLLDIIFKDNQPIKALAGGSILNASISLRALNIPVSYITQLANDHAGKLILTLLEEKGINTSHIQFYDNGNTPLALAFLDAKNDATYSFYKNYPPNIIKNTAISFTEKDYFLFGSIFAIDKRTFQWVNNLARKACNSGALTLYDPNIRFPINDIHYLHITENMRITTVIRASADDLKNIFGEGATADYYQSLKKHNCNYCIITNGSSNVELFTPDYQQIYSISAISTVSTIGAGDTFNAAILAFLYNKGITSLNISQLSIKSWDECINNAICTAQKVCLSDKNYL